MSLNKVEKIIISLVSLLVLTVVICGAYLLLIQDASVDLDVEAKLKVLPRTSQSAETSNIETEETVHLQAPLSLPDTNLPTPVVASVDLNDLWGESGLSALTGLGRDLDLEEVIVDYVANYEPVPFETVEYPSEDLYEGETLVYQEGQDGELQVTNRAVYRAGELIEYSEISRLVAKETVNQIVYYGTKPRVTEATVLVTETILQTTAAPTEVEATVKLEATTTKVTEEEAVEPEPTQEVIPPVDSSELVRFTPSDGGSDSIYANLDVLRANGILGAPNQTTMYASFEDHGSYISVNGVMVPYLSKMSKTTTSYDGLQCCVASKGACGHDPENPVNHNTASGVPAQIGLCASNEYPFGTVLFVEGYGFAVVADRHGTPSIPDLVDLCYAPGQVYDYGLPKKVRNVYLISR